MTDPAYRRVDSDRFIVERLPDGSAAVFDTTTDAVHSLNPAAVLAWDSCQQPARPTDVAHILREAGAAVDEAIARTTLDRLAQLGLVAQASAPAGVMPRRTAMRRLAASVPVVLTLTAMQQRAYAQVAGSATPTTTAPAPTKPPLPTTTTTTTTPAPGPN